MPRGNPETLKHYQPKWNSGATRTIRVPVILADTLLKIGHKLDENAFFHLSQVNTVDNLKVDYLSELPICLSKAELESLIQQVLADSEVTRKGRDRGSVKRGLQALKTLVTSEKSE